MKQKYTDQELLDILQEFYDTNGKSPRISDILQSNAIKRRFGTWNKALQMLNIPLTKDSTNHWDRTRKCDNCIKCGKSIVNTKGHKYCNICATVRKKSNSNNYYIQKGRALARKIQLVILLGGKCSICGYDKNLSALCFHHDTGKKEIKLDSRRLGNTSLQKLLLELEKCVLKCHNCHGEGHHPQYNDWKENTIAPFEFDLKYF